MKKTFSTKTLLVLAVGIALIALTLAACAAATPQVESASPETGALVEVQRITLEDSKAAFDNGAAIFLDVRSERSFDAGHIPGAVSIPLVELEPRINELDPDQWIITYCT